jgi:hypothetical protein
MASTSETGHDVNLANYRLIIDGINIFPSYSPISIKIQKISMETQWTNAVAMHSSYLAKLAETKGPINEREIIFNDLRKLVPRVNNMFAASDANDEVKKDVYGLVKKILGRGVLIKYLEDGKIDPKWISNSQQSYVKKTGNFEQMVNILALDPNYNPNEDILKIANLQTVLGELQNKNESIGGIIVHANEFRLKRDHLLYDLKTGIVDVSLQCKRYMKALFGANSPEAKSITSIKIRRFMKLEPAKVLIVTP